MNRESESFYVKCGKCGVKNRIPSSRMKDNPVCGRCKSPLSLAASYPDRYVDIGDHSFRSEVLSFPGSVIVYVWAPWCGHCRMLNPIMDRMVQDYSGRVKFTRLNLDQNPATASQYDILGVPTLLLFKGGKLVDRLYGAIPRVELERAFGKIM